MASRTPPSDRLAAWIARQRWFAGKARRIAGLAVEDRLPLGAAVLALVRIELDDGSTARYALVLPGDGSLGDALEDPRAGHALLDLIGRGGRVAGERGELTGHATRAFPRGPTAGLTVQRLGGEQSNTSLAFGEALMLKQFRRLAPGVNPELEITRFLTERTDFDGAPRLAGHLEYREPGAVTTVAVAQELIAGARDGWAWMLEALREVFRRAGASGAPPTPRRLADLAGETLAAFRRLGERTARLHRALASHDDDPAFAPEPITHADVAAWARGVERQLDGARAVLGAAAVGEVPGVEAALGGLVGRARIRHHGDFHLGQTLYRPSDGDFVIIDFEGEPLRPLEERRRKHAAVRDVAGMLRSIDYAAVSALEPGLEAGAAGWQRAAAAELVAGYRAAARDAAFVPEDEGAFERAVAAFELEKAAYEVVYEAGHRPDWVPIPARGLRRAADALRP
jgi:maltose alpha-D-glucosyltransferase/alpha-amylase